MEDLNERMGSENSAKLLGRPSFALVVERRWINARRRRNVTTTARQPIPEDVRLADHGHRCVSRAVQRSAAPDLLALDRL